MKISYSLKHTKEVLINSLVSTDLTNDQIYFDLSLVKCIALILNNHIIWSWCDGDIENYSYTLETYKENGKIFASLPKNTVITFTQNNL